jgi:hypothetical protein
LLSQNANKTLENQLSLAKNVDFQILPGEPFPTESGRVTPTQGGYPAATNTWGSSPTNSPAGQSGSSNEGSHLSAGQIAGIAIGAAGVLILAAALIYMCGRRGGFDQAYRRSTSTYHTSMPPPPVVEAKYNVTPKSPGREGWTSAQGHYVPNLAPDQYRDHSSPTANFTPRSPPMSPNNMPGFGITSPLMGNMDGTNATF